MYNKIIFNVRGYSHGVYNRGQDSAGILVYEQSSNNLFYKNTVTHGGDGFFLWAGQTTMDSQAKVVVMIMYFSEMIFLMLLQMV